MNDRPDLGVHLREAAPLIDFVKWLLVEDSELINPEEALPDRDRVTVYLAKHGSFISPLPAPALTAEYILAQGGYDDLVAVTLFHWIAEYIPGLSPQLVRYFGHSTRELQSLKRVIELMRAKRFHIIGTAPEGASSVFAYNEPMGPLTKVGLIVAALESDADIVLAAPKGVEVFGKRALVPAGGFMPVKSIFPYLGSPRGMIMSYWRPGLKARIRIKYLRYRPMASAEERAGLSESERRELNDLEIARIREKMIALYRSIPE